MISESNTEIVSHRIVQKFICDKCGKLIGKSIEYEDGYIPTPSGVNGINASFCFDHTWYKYQPGKIYCNDCIGSVKQEFLETINSIGFVEEDL